MAASADNMLLGAGIPYFDRIDKDGNFTGERDLGHFSTFSLATTVEKITKYSNRQGARRKYKEIVKQIDASAKGQMDEFDPANMALALYGDEALIRQAAEIDHVTKLKVNKDRWYKLDARDVEKLALFRAVADETPTRAAAASLTTAFAAANSNLVFTAREKGVNGNEIKIAMTSTTDQTLSVEVVNKTITVKLATTGSSVTSTANDIMSAINNNPQANALVVAAKFGSSTGTGIAKALAETALTGGVDGTAALIEGKDYDVEAETGRINILPKSELEDGSEVAAIYDIPMKTYIAINGASVGEIRGRLRFVGDTAQGSPRYEGEFWNVSVSPEGDLNLIGADEFASVTLNFSIEDDKKNHKEYPLYRLVQF